MVLSILLVHSACHHFFHFAGKVMGKVKKAMVSKVMKMDKGPRPQNVSTMLIKIVRQYNAN